MIKRENGVKDMQYKLYGDFAAVPNFHHRFLPKEFLMSDVDDIEYEFIDGQLVVHAIFEQKLLLKCDPDRPYFKTVYDRTFYSGSSGNLAVEQARLNNCALYLVIYDITDPLKRIYFDGTMTIKTASSFYNVTKSEQLLKKIYVYKVDLAWDNWRSEHYDFNCWIKYTEKEFVEFMYNIRGRKLN